MTIRWDQRKNDWLKRTRGVSFEEIIEAVLIGVQENPSRPNQNIFLFKLNGYIWIVPYVKRDNEIFLKTLYPSRKFTKKWTQGELS
jgi:hypothetical protein